MTTTSLDVRSLNKWLKANVPFHARAVRQPHMRIVIGAETGCDLHSFADAIRAELGESVIRMDAIGLRNYITIIAR